MSLGGGLPGAAAGAGAVPVAAPGAAAPRGRALLHDHRLWVTVGLLGVLAVAWLLGVLLSGHPLSGSAVVFLPLGIFLVPVLYAAVAFGLAGGMLLAILGAAATIPWAMASLSRHDATSAWLDLAQAVVLVLVAYFVGRAVRAERRAREVAETSRHDHLLAEIRYRDLFETNSQPILLVDAAGAVREANLAAEELFGAGSGAGTGSGAGLAGSGAGLAGATLAGLLGEGAARVVLRGDAGAATVECTPAAGGSPTVYRPTGRVVAVDGEEMRQVVLQDVTEDERRRRLAQAYAADVVRGQEDERRRIAQELHDGPLQTMVHMCRLIDAAADPGTLAGLRTSTESAVAEVRRIARGLRPPLLDDLGLVPALQRLCQDVEVRAGVAASLRVAGELPPTAPATELTVYRIVQEALSNVDRHAGASTVAVRLWVAGGWLQIRVADDGRGFEGAGAGDWRAGGTMGLAGMAERAALAGGQLRVASRPGAGTTVGAAVPLVAAVGPGDGGVTPVAGGNGAGNGAGNAAGSGAYPARR